VVFGGDNASCVIRWKSPFAYQGGIIPAAAPGQSRLVARENLRRPLANRFSSGQIGGSDEIRVAQRRGASHNLRNTSWLGYGCFV
jgi:hypothetical protein